jgi:hypothetical protein
MPGTKGWAAAKCSILMYSLMSHQKYLLNISKLEHFPPFLLSLVYSNWEPFGGCWAAPTQISPATPVEMGGGVAPVYMVLLGFAAACR